MRDIKNTILLIEDGVKLYSIYKILSIKGACVCEILNEA